MYFLSYAMPSITHISVLRNASATTSRSSNVFHHFHIHMVLLRAPPATSKMSTSPPFSSPIIFQSRYLSRIRRLTLCIDGQRLACTEHTRLHSLAKPGNWHFRWHGVAGPLPKRSGGPLRQGGIVSK